MLEAIDAAPWTARFTGACSTTASDLTTTKTVSGPAAAASWMSPVLEAVRDRRSCHGPRRRRPTAACRSQSTSTLRVWASPARRHALRLRGRHASPESVPAQCWRGHSGCPGCPEAWAASRGPELKGRADGSVCAAVCLPTSPMPVRAFEPQDRGTQPWARHRDEAAAPATGRRDAPAVADRARSSSSPPRRATPGAMASPARETASTAAGRVGG